MTSDELIEAHFSSINLEADQLDHDVWSKTPSVLLSRYWFGAPAPVERHATARVLWTNEALLVRFECRQAEPLIINPAPQTTTKTIGLWDRDVTEIFLVPDPRQLNRYFEFEAAPTGEWIDLAIVATPDERITDWDFHSGMTVAARIEPHKMVTSMHIPWSGLPKKPDVGEEWRVNLCRCVGRDPDRGYLAWRPTYTEVPNFHVPEVFGRLRFSG